MKKHFLNIFKGNRAAGIEVVFLPEKGYHVNLSLIKVSSGNLSIEKTVVGLDEITKIKEHISNDIPLCLVFNGKGIIHKNIEITEKDEGKTLVRKVIPNAGIKDFYLQAQPRMGGHGFVSIIRKTIADEIITVLKSNGYFIVSVQLGAFSLVPIASLLDENLKGKTSYELKSGGHNITINNGAVEEYLFDKASATLKKEISIDSKPISSDALIALSAALGYLQPEIQTSDAHVSGVESDKEEFHQKKIFTTVGWGALVLFLVILMANYMLFDSFTKEKHKLQIQVTKYADLEKVQAKMNEIKVFIDSMRIAEPSVTSYYTDQIINSVPLDFNLSKLVVNPLRKKIKKNERIEFNYNAINITGECEKSKDLDDWLKNIQKEFSWIKEINVIGYTQNNSNEKAEFQLQILLK